MFCDELRNYINMINDMIKIYNKQKDTNTTKLYMTQYKNYDNIYKLHQNEYELDKKIKILENAFVILYNGYTSICPNINKLKCNNIKKMINELLFLSDISKINNNIQSNNYIKLALQIEEKYNNNCKS
jgi:hypothetical protein